MSFEWSTNSSSSASLIHSYTGVGAGSHAPTALHNAKAQLLSVICSFLVECHIKGLIIVLASVLKGKAVLLTEGYIAIVGLS